MDRRSSEVTRPDEPAEAATATAVLLEDRPDLSSSEPAEFSADPTLPESLRRMSESLLSDHNPAVDTDITNGNAKPQVPQTVTRVIRPTPREVNIPAGTVLTAHADLISRNQAERGAPRSVHDVQVPPLNDDQERLLKYVLSGNYLPVSLRSLDIRKVLQRLSGTVELETEGVTARFITLNAFRTGNISEEDLRGGIVLKARKVVPHPTVGNIGGFHDKDANCNGWPPDLFVPEKMSTATTKKALEVCAGCVVSKACLTYALMHNMDKGVWGGMRPRERNSLRKQMGLVKPKKSASKEGEENPLTEPTAEDTQLAS